MAGMIPREFIDQLIARIDLVDIINQRISLKKQGREFQACCPFHNEKNPSFTVSPSKQFYHCFGCGAHGTAISFIMEFDQVDYVEAIEIIADSLGLSVPREQRSNQNQPSPKVAQDVYQIMQQVAEFYQKQLQQAIIAQQYLSQRGVSNAIAERFLLGYSPAEWNATKKAFPHPVQGKALITGGVQIQHENGKLYDRFRDRLMFPIRDRRGRVIGFGGRVLGDGSPKYLNSPETDLFHKGRELYGFYEARHNTRQLERLLVVEGYMDVIALAQFDVSYAVATLGTATTAEHVTLLFKAVTEVIFCFDGDRAGKQAAWRALGVCLPLLGDAREVRFLFLPDGHDPDSLIRLIGKAQFEERCTAAFTLSDYFFAELANEHNLHTREGKSAFFVAAREYLVQMQHSDFKVRLVDELIKRTASSDLPVAFIWQQVAYREQGVTHKNQADVPKQQTTQRLMDDTRVRRSPIRFAIAVLIHYPHFIEYLGNPEQLARYPLPGIDLLLTLVEIIEEQPHIHSAGLLERLRATKYESAILKLMHWQPQEATEAVIQQEFQDCLQQIKRQALEKQLENLLHRKQTETLNTQEQHDLRSLLAEIHQKPYVH